MIAPRALYIENGTEDALFPIDMVREEYERLKPFYEAANAADNLLVYVGENGHCVSCGDMGFDFFIDKLI